MDALRNSKKISLLSVGILFLFTFFNLILDAPRMYIIKYVFYDSIACLFHFPSKVIHKFVFVPFGLNQLQSYERLKGLSGKNRKSRK
jgi:hypothetical protein